MSEPSQPVPPSSAEGTAQDEQLMNVVQGLAAHMEQLVVIFDEPQRQ